MSPRLLSLALCLLPVIATASETRWWPEQKTPKTLAVIDSGEFARLTTAAGTPAMDASRSTYHMLAASLAGLAAQAVNEGRGSEMVWVAMRGSKSYAEWLERWTKRTGVPTHKAKLWELVTEYSRQGIVKGYILYTHETVNRDDRKENPANESANAATVMAGLLGGVLIDESLQAEAEKAGLKMLLDARKLTEKEVFDREKSRLDQQHVLLQTPELPFGRDMAIAHRMMTMFGREEPTPEVYQWLQPIGTVFGWNLDPEDKAVNQISEAGHVIVPCDWAPNMPVLSCGAPASLQGAQLAKFRAPVSTPVKHDQSVMGVMMSDGDNLQWALTTLAHNPKFWGNQTRHEFPMGWGLPLGDLIQTSPDAYQCYVDTQGDKTSILLHLGYYYPDNFGKLRGPEQRAALLAQLARRMEYIFKATGTSLLTFLVHDPESAAAKEAYQIFAEESPSLTAMLTIQYNPYEEAEGQTRWATRKDGSEVPVIPASYSIWKLNPQDAKKRPHGLAPTALAEAVADRAKSATKPFSEWTVVHAWSEFPDEFANEPNAHPQGVDPTVKFERLLNSTVPIVTIEQIVSRQRENKK